MVDVTVDPAKCIWAQEPATRFFESSVLGNGRLGAMVFGDPKTERVVLNESGMWSGGPQDADREDAHLFLAQIRQLMAEGRHVEAEAMTQAHFTCKGPGGAGPLFGCYQVFANLLLEVAEAGFSDYRRVLDLDSAVATVSYRSGGVHFTREAFVSAPHQAFVYRLIADRPGTVSFSASLQREAAATVRVDGNDLVIEGKLDPGVGFKGRLKIMATGGKVGVRGTSLFVEGADEAVLIFTAGTSLNDADFERTVDAQIEAASSTNYAELKAKSIEDHRHYFRRVELTLPAGPLAKKPTVERLKANIKGEGDPSLAALLFHFGRYLLISGSRPDSPLPTNLQGIWAEELQTPWNGDFHLDINVQMNYWPVEAVNLGDCHQPLLNYIPKLVPNGEKTAQAYYQARGWVAHVITNPWHFTSPGEYSSWGSFTTGGGWLCQHLWNHYAYSLDREYLKQIYPTLKGAAQFFLDILTKDAKHGWLVTGPSNSPESKFLDPETGKPIANCMGPTCDTQIVREVFTNVISAAKVLDTDSEFADEVASALPQLAPTRVGKHGQVMEWLEDYDEEDVHHRHLSHLYGLYPGDQISPDATPDLAEAAKVTLRRKSDDGVGWSLAHKASLWARLWEGDHAWKLLKRQLNLELDTGIRYDGGGGTYPNMLAACPPFQIDANFGATAAIAEMLVQGDADTIWLLPALPAAWKEGSFRGLRVRVGRTVDVTWRDGKVTHHQIHGPAADQVKVLQP
ncbi:MAG: glycoside hydrolase family 95 protein [Armatimonadetes bacterium]|nr:glycoside hydrolase family 95 protein [Armatimonadota bacterium]